MNSALTSDLIDYYLQKLFPINRSITGEGNRETLKILQEIIPIELMEYPSGRQVYDWQIPDEWRIKEAWIKDEDNNVLVDFKESNLHLVGYSQKVNKKMTFEELMPRLHYLDDQPDAIPYRTSYYKRDWGFCVTRKQYQEIKKSSGELEVCIQSSFDPQGSMTVGELLIPGECPEEYIVSTYFCHPSMANDNLSGLLCSAFLAKHILNSEIGTFSWRFVFVPETIGSIAYLHENEDKMDKAIGGLVVTCCGGKGKLGYKGTFLGDHIIDKAIRIAFRDRGITPLQYPFVPDGSDERQYSSPGFRIPMATITKDKYYEYPQYHTSSDDLSLVNGLQIMEALNIYKDTAQILDDNHYYVSTVSKGEARLSDRGLYPTVGGSFKQSESVEGIGTTTEQIDIISWLLFLGDGKCDLINVADRLGITYSRLIEVFEMLRDKKLVEISNRPSLS